MKKLTKRVSRKFLSTVMAAALVMALMPSALFAVLADEPEVDEESVSVEAEAPLAMDDVCDIEEVEDDADEDIIEDDAEDEEDDFDDESYDDVCIDGEADEDVSEDVEDAEDADDAVASLSLKAKASDAKEEGEIKTLADGYTVGTGGTYRNLASAISAHSNGDFVLVSDISEDCVTISSGDVTVDLDGYTITSTSGQLFRLEGGLLTINDSSGDDSGKLTGGSGTNGGAIYVTDASSVLTVNGGTITGNSASSHGGGIDINRGELVINGGVIADNSAPYGGGVSVHSTTTSSPFTMTGGTISDNEATSSGSRGGGGLYITTDGVMTGGVIYNNHSAAQGGGISSTGGNLTVSGVTVSDNDADTYGAGIYATGTVDMANSTVSGNSQTGSGGSAIGGGGIYLTGTFTIENSDIVENKALRGAGIMAYGGEIAMSGVTVSKNNATGGSGGGIFANNGAEAFMTGGDISDNTSRYNGAGICLSNTADTSKVDFTLNDGQITGNVADGNAGGIYVEGIEATLTVCGGTVKENTDSNGGSNVYLHDDALITLGADLTNEDMIGVTVETAPDEYAPVQFTTAESAEGTTYYSSSLGYFSSDQGYSKRITVLNNLDYLEFYVLSAFESSYITDANDAFYTTVTAENYKQILGGESDWNNMTSDQQDYINAVLTDANGGNPLTYPELLLKAQEIDAAVNGFEDNYLRKNAGDPLYTVATADNYAQILAGEADWEALTDEEKAAINADLTEANGGVELTYPMLLEQAKVFEKGNQFVKDYVTGDDGNTYKEATVDNYMQILAGEDEWNAMSQEEKDAVNAILAANGSPTYEELLAQAKAIAAGLEETEQEEEIEEVEEVEDVDEGEEAAVVSSTSPKTGDFSSPYTYLFIIAIAAAVVIVVMARKRQRS